MNKALEREAGFESESTQRRYQSAAEKVVRALLFCDEVPLSARIAGTSRFAAEFEQHGPIDRAGRSLRQPDLHRRLFKYPCSFLIYSDAYRALPDGVLSRVESRLAEILSGAEKSEDFAHLSTDDRTQIAELLAATR